MGGVTIRLQESWHPKAIGEGHPHSVAAVGRSGLQDLVWSPSEPFSPIWLQPHAGSCLEQIWIMSLEPYDSAQNSTLQLLGSLETSKPT